jgi:hypothetical protein
MTYLEPYSERLEFFLSQSLDSFPLKVLKTVVNLNDRVTNQGVEEILKGAWVTCLRKIRDYKGLNSYCWGEVCVLLQYYHDYKKDPALLNKEQFLQATQTLIYRLLEILPAFIFWSPPAKNPENQALIDKLQEYSNTLRKMGDPSFLGYDQTITTFSKMDFVINSTNCRFIEGTSTRIVTLLKKWQF